MILIFLDGLLERSKQIAEKARQTKITIDTSTQDVTIAYR